MASILSLLLARQLIVPGENNLLETYCKGTVLKKGDKILPGSSLHAYYYIPTPRKPVTKSYERRKKKKKQK